MPNTSTAAAAAVLARYDIALDRVAVIAEFDNGMARRSPAISHLHSTHS